jgi:hypothetical protein
MLKRSIAIPSQQLLIPFLPLNRFPMPKLTFKMYGPKGFEHDHVEYQKLRADMYANLYVSFKKEMLSASQKPLEERAFTMIAEADISNKPVVWEFRWAQSGTSARVIWTRPTPEGQIPDLQGVSLLFTRMDMANENEKIDSMKPNPHLSTIDPSSFEALKNEPGPVVGTFFVNDEARQDSLIHALTQMTAAAFFDQFGMADPQYVLRMKFNGMLFLPDGAKGNFIPHELHLSPEEEQQLFQQFRTAMQRETGFLIGMNVSGDALPLTIRF